MFLQGGAECRLLLSWCSFCSSLIQAVIAPTRRRPTRAFPTFLGRDQYISYIDSSSVSCPMTFWIAVIPRAHNGFDGAAPGGTQIDKIAGFSRYGTRRSAPP